MMLQLNMDWKSTCLRGARPFDRIRRASRRWKANQRPSKKVFNLLNVDRSLVIDRPSQLIFYGCIDAAVFALNASNWFNIEQRWGGCQKWNHPKRWDGKARWWTFYDVLYNWHSIVVIIPALFQMITLITYGVICPSFLFILLHAENTVLQAVVWTPRSLSRIRKIIQDLYRLKGQRLFLRKHIYIQYYQPGKH